MNHLRERLFARVEPLEASRAAGLIGLLILMILSLVLWAQWARLEEQVRAPGKVVASSGSQLVQVVDGGVLKAIHVSEGDTVEAGQVIAELDTTRFSARADETRSRALGLQASIERLSAELEDRPIEFSPEVAAEPALVRGQQNLYDRRREQLQQAQQNLRRSLALAEQELRSLKSLQASGDAGVSEVLRSERQVTELRGQLTNAVNEYRKEAQEQLVAARGELEQVREVLVQRQQALDATKIRAPMAGQVKSIGVSTLGAVLAPGDELLRIVPSDEALLVEARVSSADVAFLRAGLEARVKLDAYDFTVYGALNGRVTYISPDIIDTDLERDQEPYYRVLIELTGGETVRGTPIEVIPGMSALIEIISGDRTVAQYLLKPLLRGWAAALTER